MSDLERYYRVTNKDLAKDKALKYGSWAAPLLLSVLPALIFFIIGVLSTTPASVAVFFTIAVISFIAGLFLGLVVTGILLYYRSRWLTQIRERIAVDGIRAEEVEWFKHELTTAEKKSLREIEARSQLLGDAFRETLASRLTATRIIKTTKQELLLVQRRQNKLKYLKSEKSADFLEDLKKDRENLDKINQEAREMLAEAETRLQMIDAAARRGTSFADTELALKKLTAQSEQLPLALEAVKMEDEIRRELENEQTPKLES